MHFPLQSEGTTIFLSTRTPTEKELHECAHIELTSKAPRDPHAVQFPEPARRVEEGLSDDLSTSARTIHSIRLRHSCTPEAECFCAGDTVCPCPQQIVERLVAAVRIPEVLNDVPSRRTFVSNDRSSSVTPEELSERWCIGLEQARNTVRVTTQKGTRSAILPLSRRYRADRVFERPLLRGNFYSDTMDGRHKSLDGNKYAQVFANKDFFGVAYPMESKSGAGDALRQFVHEFGRPEKLTTDGSREQTGKKTEFMANVRKYAIEHTVTEPDRPNHNFAEGVIRELRKKWFRVVVKQNVPRRLWDYGLRWVCDIQNRTSNSSRKLGGRCPLEKVTGESVDISEYLDFRFYDWVWYKDNAGLGETKLGRWLGVSHKIGTLMLFWILTEGRQVLSRTTVQRVTNLERQAEDVSNRCRNFDIAVAPRVGDPDYHDPDGNGKTNASDWEHGTAFDDEFNEEFHKVISDDKLPETDDTFTPDMYDDTYINMELALPRGGGEVELGRVTKRLRDKDGLPIGTANDNPILDTRVYEVEFPDGHKASLAANAIAENLFSQIDDEGNRHVILDEIIGHRTNGKELKQQKAFLTLKSGTKRRRETTIGWEILAQWKDNSSTWIALKDFKDAYPVQLAEYAVASKISDEPAFA